MEQPVSDEQKVKVSLGLGADFDDFVREQIHETYLDGAAMGLHVAIKTVEGVMNHPGLHQVQRDAMEGLKQALKDLNIREVLAVNFDGAKTDGLYPDH